MNANKGDKMLSMCWPITLIIKLKTSPLICTEDTV